MQDAVDHLFDLPRFTKKNSLAHTRRLMELLGDPCADRRVIHVAGSNGKGSVCCYLYHMLLAGGATVGLFTSPHLVDLRERFQVNGRMVSEDMFLGAYERVRDAIGDLCAQGDPPPTFFEQVYAIGMVLFEEADVDWIVLETGLGGRLDATNSFPTPTLTVITSIAREHTEILGDTIGEIAAEKAGILKPGVPVVFSAGDGPDGTALPFEEEERSRAARKSESGAAARVIVARARTLGCPAVAVTPFSGGSDEPTRKEGRSTAAFPPREQGGRTGVSPREVSEIFYEISEIRENAIDFFLVSDYDNTTTWTVPGRALYQVQNAALAVTAMRTLRRAENSPDGAETRPRSCSEIADVPSRFPADGGGGKRMLRTDDATLRQGLLAAVWPGRMQEAKPGIWLDGAHNPAGIRAFLVSAREMTREDADPPLLLVAMLREKDLESSVLLLSEADWERVVVTAIPAARSADPGQLAALFSRGPDGDGREDRNRRDPGFSGRETVVMPDCREAFSLLCQSRKPGQKLFCTGSLYLIGTLLEQLESKIPGVTERQDGKARKL